MYGTEVTQPKFEGMGDNDPTEETSIREPNKENEQYRRFAEIFKGSVVLSTCVVLMLISRYTILAGILLGKRNWMEVAGAIVILLGSSLGSVKELCKA